MPANPVKIKPGQIWKKKDNGFTIQITGKRCMKGRDYYSYEKIGGKSSGHRISNKDLYHFWLLQTV